MKKVFALMLALVCAIGSLTGCKEKVVSVNDIDAEGKYILPEESLDLTIWATQGTDYTPVTPIEDSVVVKWLNEQTNVTIKSMYGNGGGQYRLYGRFQAARDLRGRIRRNDLRQRSRRIGLELYPYRC